MVRLLPPSVSVQEQVPDAPADDEPTVSAVSTEEFQECGRSQTMSLAKNDGRAAVVVLPHASAGRGILTFSIVPRSRTKRSHPSPVADLSVKDRYFPFGLSGEYPPA